MVRIAVRGRLVIAVAVATASIGVGVGTALALTGDQTETDQQFTGTDQLDRGVTPNGNAYVVSRFESKHQGFCLEVTANGLGAKACLLVPEAGAVGHPIEVGLGDDLFVIALAHGDVKGSQIERLRVTRADGRGSGTSPSAAKLGSLRLLHSVLSAPQSTLPLTDFGLPVPPTVKVEALDAEGESQQQRIVAAPLRGGGRSGAEPPHSGSHEQARDERG